MENCLRKFKIYKNGFTLAEVLITLVIIGVVAAMTIPTLSKNTDEKSNIIAFKKVYSAISQVNLMLNNESGGDWTTQCSDFNNRCFRDLFAKKMSVTKICDNPLSEGCVASSKFLNGATTAYSIVVNDSWPALVTSSGYSIKFRFHLNGCVPDGTVEGRQYTNLSCGWVQIDTNGHKNPNVVGKDIFFLEILPDRSVKPFGSDGDISQYGGKTAEQMKNDCYNGSGMYCGYIYLMESK